MFITMEVYKRFVDMLIVSFRMVKIKSNIAIFTLQVIKRIEEWDIIQEQIDKPYIPPIVVRWDVSPRGSIPESVVLLSKILPDGSVDNSYLAKIRELRDEYGF